MRRESCSASFFLDEISLALLERQRSVIDLRFRKVDREDLCLWRVGGEIDGRAPIERSHLKYNRGRRVGDQMVKDNQFQKIHVTIGGPRLEDADR